MGEAALKTSTDRPLEELGDVGLKVFFNIADEWKLSEAEQMRILGLASRATLHTWKAGKVSRISRDTVERISYVFGIYKAIAILLPSRQHANDYMRTPNDAPIFNGRTPIDRMAAGNMSDLFMVRRYLDAERG